MSSRLLLDNWTLQSAGQLLSSGFSNAVTQEIAFAPDGQSFRYVEIPENVIALECLCQLLHNVVLGDELYVDADFASSWEKHPSMALLADEHVVRRKPLKAAKADWVASREAMVEQLSFCPQIRERHILNRERYAAAGETVDAMLSQVLWGGAGMLARADYLRVPYVPHPLRQRLLARARVLLGPTNAQTQLRSFVDAQRAKVFARADASGFFAELRVPPVIVEVVHAASTVEDLVPAALELRSTYRELRGWLGEFQTALDQDDMQAVLARHQALESISRHIDQLSGSTTAGEGSIQFGLSWLKITKNIGSPLNDIRNKLGVRAQINRLIVAPAGRRALEKLLALLGGDSQGLLLKGLVSAQGAV